MSWTPVVDWADSVVWTAADLNAQLIANPQYLHDRVQSLVMHSTVFAANSNAGIVAPVYRVSGGTATQYEIQRITSTTGTVSAVVNADAVFDLNRNGTTIYTTQANRPTRQDVDGTGVKTHLAPDVTTFQGGDVFRLDLDSSTTVGNYGQPVFKIEYVEQA